jgi:hypothetical protein
MKRFIAVSLSMMFLSSLGGGCVVVEKRSAALMGRGSPRCHPSQYWDGNQCRHKGKGHGARKHDGRSR